MPLNQEEVNIINRFGYLFDKPQNQMFNQDELSAVERFVSPTPKFQTIIQIIGVFLGCLGAALMQLETENLVVLPIWLSWIATKATIVSAAIATIVAQFSVDYKAKAEKEAFSNLKN